MYIVVNLGFQKTTTILPLHTQEKQTVYTKNSMHCLHHSELGFLPAEEQWLRSVTNYAIFSLNKPRGFPVVLRFSDSSQMSK